CRFEAPFGALFFSLPQRRFGCRLQLGVGPLLTGFPVGIDMSAKLASGVDLLPCHRGLRLGQKPRAGLACDGLSQAVIRTVAGLGVVGASAARLTTPNRAIGQR